MTSVMSFFGDKRLPKRGLLIRGELVSGAEIIFVRSDKGGKTDLVLLLGRGGRVVRRCWVNFQCRGVLQYGLQ